METKKCDTLIIYKLEFFNSSINNERTQNMKNTISKPPLTLINSITAIPVSCDFENNAHVTKPESLTLSYLSSCDFEAVRQGVCTKTAVVFLGSKSTKQKGVRKFWQPRSSESTGPQPHVRTPEKHCALFCACHFQGKKRPSWVAC